MTTVEKIVELYWEMQEADEHYSESTQAKALACGLADEFHALMKDLRKELRQTNERKA
jgi:hypothetical protein